jgi:hypothetical protein
MTDIARHNFAETLAEAVRILTLGRALSAAHPGTLSQREVEGFLVGTLRPGPNSTPSIAVADPDGRLGNDLPAHADPDAGGLHAAVLGARPKAGAVVLVRSPRLAAWGLSHRPLPVRYFQMFGYTNAPEIPVARARPDEVAATLAHRPDAPALLLDDGRTLIWALQPARAVRLVLSLEEAAYVTALADQIGGAKDYPAEAREKIYLSLQAQARR